MASLDEVGDGLDDLQRDLDRAFVGTQIVAQELVSFQRKLTALVLSEVSTAESGQAASMTDQVIREVDGLASRITSIVEKLGEIKGSGT